MCTFFVMSAMFFCVPGSAFLSCAAQLLRERLSKSVDVGGKFHSFVSLAFFSEKEQMGIAMGGR